MEDDRNGPGQEGRFIKDVASSPSVDEATCASTVATGTASQPQQQPTPPANVNMVAVAPARNLNQEQQALQQQIVQLGAVSTGALGLLVVYVIPMPVLVGMAIVLFLWAAFFVRVLQFLQMQYQEGITGRGFGHFLPDSIYQRLVNESFHEMMTTGNVFDEYQHFALYFPGIPEAVRDAHIRRLLPRQREVLQRPGLGHFLGPGVMRFILGDQGLAEENASEVVAAHRGVSSSARAITSASGASSGGGANTPRRVPRRLELPASSNDTTASGLGEDDDDVVDAPREREILFEEEDEDDEEDPALNREVIMDAMWETAMSYANWMVGLTVGQAGQAVTRGATFVLRASLGLGVVSVGAGMVGVYAGVISPQDLPRMPSNMPRVDQRVFFSSAAASGALLMLGLRSVTSSSSTTAPSKPTRRQSTKKPSSSSPK